MLTDTTGLCMHTEKPRRAPVMSSKITVPTQLTAWEGYLGLFAELFAGTPIYLYEQNTT